MQHTGSAPDGQPPRHGDRHRTNRRRPWPTGVEACVKLPLPGSRAATPVPELGGAAEQVPVVAVVEGELEQAARALPLSMVEPTSAAELIMICTVCLVELHSVATTLPCSHAYCPWLAVHRACPCCRAAVTEA